MWYAEIDSYADDAKSFIVEVSVLVNPLKDSLQCNFWYSDHANQRRTFGLPFPFTDVKKLFLDAERGNEVLDCRKENWPALKKRLETLNTPVPRAPRPEPF